MYLARSNLAFPFTQVSQGSVVTIGAFDGLHLGHQRLLNRVLEEATARKLRAVVMSFEPTPKEFFAGKNRSARLTRFREKYLLLKNMGFDVFFCPPFNRSMKSITADAFIRTLLVHALNIRHLVIGDDFQFARNREGNVALLRRAGKVLNFGVEQMASVVVEGERVSSTAIRDALGQGDLIRARRLLGDNYQMAGKVIRDPGYAVDERIVFISTQRRLSPVEGIFAVKVHGIGENALGASACIGMNTSMAARTPFFTLGGIDVERLSDRVHVNIEFMARIRGPEACRSIAEGIAQLHECESEVQRVLAEREQDSS